MSTKRIDLSLFDDNLKGLINASAKIFPMSLSDVQTNLNPNLYEYARIIDMGVHKNEIYIWNNSVFELIGADDKQVDFNTELINKPLSYPPSIHSHDDLYYTKLISDNNLSLKVNKITGKDLSTNDFTNDNVTKLASLSNSASVDYTTMQTSLNNHTTNGTVHVTQTDHDNINLISGKADKTYVDTQDATKVDSTTFTGHTNNTTVHVLQTDKDSWNSKAPLASPSFTGKIGLNTTPLRTLTVKAIDVVNIAFEGIESAGVHAIYIRPNTSGGNLISSDYMSSSTYKPLCLSGRENVSDFILDTNGNVGIGVAGLSPSEKLEVVGNIKATGTIIGSNTTQIVQGTIEPVSTAYWNEEV